MEHINTLKAYKEYKKAGYTEDQAVAAVEVLNTAFDGVATSKDLQILESNLKIFFTFEILAVAIFVITLPKAIDFLSHIYRWPIKIKTQQ